MVEFAMISVPLLGLIGAIFESGMVYFNSAQLQTVTELASRSLQTHTADESLTYGDFIKQKVCTHGGVGTAPVAPGTLSTMFDCSKVIVDIATSSEFKGTNVKKDFLLSSNNWNSTSKAFPSGISPQKVMVVRIIYQMSPAMAILSGGALNGSIQRVTVGKSLDGNGQLVDALMGVYAFRVEPP